MNIDAALEDPRLLGAALGDPATWQTWLTVLRAAFGLPLAPDELDTFRTLAGGRDPPDARVGELWAVAGRRSGKSRMAGAVATYLALFEAQRHPRAPGERGHVLVLAPSRDQARETFSFIEGFLTSSPILAKQVESIGAEEVRLEGRISIGVHAANFRTVRGRTILACIFDESAFWRDETSAQPDVEIYRAVLPALAASRGMLVGISSPYRRTGLLHSKWRDHYGQPGDVLVVQASTATLNPTIDHATIERAMAADPEAGPSEWNAEFRSDIAALLGDDVIENAIDHGRPLELPPDGRQTYTAFVDASAGRHDAFTCCIGHKDGDVFIADVVRGVRPPFDPASVAAEFATLARSYGCYEVVGDAFAGEWTAQAFRQADVQYEKAASPKSTLYLESVAAFAQGNVRIPAHPVLLRELRTLERSTHRSGRDSVDHPRHGSDDFANALVGALVTTTSAPVYGMLSDVVMEKGIYAREPSYWDRYNFAMMQQRRF